MEYSVDQVEKHTIVCRLSVSVYKMDDEQLLKLQQTLEEGEDVSGIYHFSNEDENLQRHMRLARIFVLVNILDKDRLLEKLSNFSHPEFRWVREYPRLTCFLVVDFAMEGKAYRSCIRDISASGVFIETKENFKLNQKVALCYTLTESNETLPFKIMGRVSRLYPDGIGVHYENITEYQRDIIDTLIKRNGH
ncbi:MAG: PilZ domain-containing protein [Desulfobacteraceae bacterium]|nr:PilZ domain-containing protein [Desulfobacteraceae bacterium]